MVKTLFYTGARVSEVVNLRVTDRHLALDPPQVHIVHAKDDSDGDVLILPALAQELRTHLAERRTGDLFESNRHDGYTARSIQLIVQDTARWAGSEKTVTPHRLRASVATILPDAGMPLDQVQKFLRHNRMTTTQMDAQTSACNVSESDVRALGHR